MTEFGGEVVEVVVEPDVPFPVAGVDARDGVELGEEGCRLRGVEVGEPGGIVAADAVGGVELGSLGTGVLWFETVDAGGLDGHGDGLVRDGGVQADCDLAGDLGCYDVVGDPEFHPVRVEFSR